MVCLKERKLAGTHISKRKYIAIRWTGDMLAFARSGIIVDGTEVFMSPPFATVVSKIVPA